jgi:hypothetical protein
MTSSWRTPERDLAIGYILAYGVIALGIGLPAALLAGWPLWLAVPVLIPVLGTGIFLLQRALAFVAGAAVARLTGSQMGDRDTRAHFAFSAVDTLVVRGQIEAAIATLRTEQYAYDGHTGAEIAQRLGDLCLKRGDAEDAAQSFRRARRLWESVAGAEGREGRMYTTRRLLDLYEGSPANEAAAARERERLAAG